MKHSTFLLHTPSGEQSKGKLIQVLVVTAWCSIQCLVQCTQKTIFIRMLYKETHDMIEYTNRAMGMSLAFPKDGCKIFNRVLNWNFSGFCSHRAIDLAQLGEMAALRPGSR